MVSRQTTRPLRKLVPAVAIGVSALLGIVGCGAGQVTQTARMEPAVNGNTGQAGDIMLRDVRVAFPESGEPYEEGDDAPLLLAIVNVGADEDRLVGATSPAGRIEMVGNPSLPPQTALQVVLPEDNPAASSAAGTTTTTTSQTSQTSETSGAETPGSESSSPESSSPESSSPESSQSSSSELPTAAETEAVSPSAVGTLSLVITGLTGELPFGKTVPVTFEFERAGTVTISLPIAAPATPRPQSTEGAEGH
jgi:copper(I)-binding protein